MYISSCHSKIVIELLMYIKNIHYTCGWPILEWLSNIDKYRKRWSIILSEFPGLKYEALDLKKKLNILRIFSEYYTNTQWTETLLLVYYKQCSLQIILYF